MSLARRALALSPSVGRISVVAALGALLLSAPLLAQAPSARISGRVLDAATGQGIPDVGIQIVGTLAGTTSGVAGRYTLSEVRPGTITLQFRRLGFQPKTVTGLLLQPGEAITQDVTLTSASVALTAVRVNAALERGSVREALDRQRTAVGVVNGVTAEQIARAPDRDAAQAVQRVSGVTVQDGRYVFVRGLGERYTNTSLNGARLPSPETERKVVPLDLFPATLLQTITTTKTFTPDLPGDFAGATVDIQTREFPARTTWAITNAIGANDAATGRRILAAPRTGTEWLGYAGRQRDLPLPVRANGSFTQSGITQPMINGAVASFRNVWSPARSSGIANTSWSSSVGGQAPVGRQSVGYLLSGSYALAQEVRRDEEHAIAVGDGVGRQRPFNAFVGETGEQSVRWGGLANFGALLGDRTHVTLNNLYARTADNQAHEDEGLLDKFDAAARRSWLSFVARTVQSSQLRVERLVSARQNLEIGLTTSSTSRQEPDRAELVYVKDPGGAYLWLAGEGDGAERSFSSLRERNLSATADYRLELLSVQRPLQLRLGVATRRTSRDVEQLNYGIGATGLSNAELALPAESIFDGRFSQPSARYFRLGNNSDGGAYTATDGVGAGYVMLEYPLAERVRVVGGARVERWHLALHSEPVAGERGDTLYRATDVLPSLSVILRLSDQQTLRLAASRTLSRPEYRELSRLTYRNPVGEVDFVGNPALERARIHNLDLRWEAYPRRGEVVSIALFGKRFDRPIEMIQIGTAGGALNSYVNARAATNYGMEIDARTALDVVAGALSPWTVFTNLTLMRSRIELGNEEISALTNARRAMVGQAPYVVNAGLQYDAPSGATSASLLYNVVGPRVTAAGSIPVPDQYLMPRPMLDLTVQQTLSRAAAVRVSARNILDAPVLETQGSVVRTRYTTGRVVSVGVSIQR